MKKIFLTILLPIIMYISAAKFGALYNLPDSNASLVWPASGLAVVFYFIFNWTVALPLLVAGFCANYLNGNPLYTSLALGLAVLIQAISFNLIFKKFSLNPIFVNHRNILIILTSIVCGILGATLGISSHLITKPHLVNSLFTIFSTWAWGDAAGIYLVFSIFIIGRSESLKNILNFKNIGIFIISCFCSICFFYYNFLYSLIMTVFLLNILLFSFTHKLFSYIYPLIILVITVYFQQQGIGPFNLLPYDSELEHKFFFMAIFASTELFSFLKLKKTSKKTMMIFFITWLISVTAYFLTYNLEVTKEYLRVRTDINKIKDQITERFKNYSDALNAGRAFLLANENNINDKNWGDFVTEYKILENYPGINGMGIIYKIETAGEEKFIKKIKKTNPDRSFELRTVPVINENIPYDIKNSKYIITYIEPYEKNKLARGLVISSEKNRALAADYSRDNNQFVISSKITLIQDQKKGPGFLLFLPVKHQDNFIGWIYAPLICEVFFSTLFHDYNGIYDFKIFYEKSVEHSNEIFSSRTDQKEDNFYQKEYLNVGSQNLTLYWKKNSNLSQEFFPYSMIFGCLMLIVSFLITIVFQNIEDRGVEAKTIALKITDELKNANEKLKVAIEAKTIFLANMSHEIRTPLNGIIGLINLMFDTSITKEQRELLNGAKNSSESLIVIINDILEHSKIEAGKLELENIPFDLNVLISDLNFMLKASANKKGIDFELINNVEGKNYLIGDFFRLKQVLINLCVNGIKFTTKGTVKLVISKCSIDNLIKFEIIDTGIGMDNDVLSKIFNPFSQSDSSTTRKFGGTGLGLSISKRLISLMGGDLLAESEVGKGSRFYFEISLPIGELIKAKANFSNEQLISSVKLKVLLAEDNEVNQFVAIKLLQKLGHEVVVAKNGKEAFEKRFEENFDLILMDYHMPEVDGLESTRMIRNKENTDQLLPIYIIALTANVMIDDQKRCLNAGMNEFLTKPIYDKVLYNCFEKFILKYKG